MIDPTSEHISAVNEKANAWRRKQMHALTPEECLALSRQLQQAAIATMRSNPKAVEAFIKRNHHQRRASNVKRLEMEMKHECGLRDE